MTQLPIRRNTLSPSSFVRGLPPSLPLIVSSDGDAVASIVSLFLFSTVSLDKTKTKCGLETT
eukprot:scaffold232093_cov77-Cyclotella_meneghiniana.AAC.1